jgi:2-C-methyl-D-erythritol 4-phosphate cytidylyltransferase/2-C-methyl-D-erythritol 2,4-cyclodiphosphate synthase
VHSATVAVVVAAAGSGSRFANTTVPKQFLFLDEVVEKFASVSYVSVVVCVLPAAFLHLYRDYGKVRFVSGGDNRQESVLLGLQALVDFNPKYVLIHDAARPYCSVQLINTIINELRSGKESVVPFVSPVDSVVLEEKYISRNSVSLMQTPQGFNFCAIYELHKKYRGMNSSDDAFLFQLDDRKINLVHGDVKNKKVTYSNDVIDNNNYRIGFGFDSHNFSKIPQRKLVLGGVLIPNMVGLDGVSDADVVIHSLIDAMLGASNCGDIGEHFPNNDQLSQDANSLEFLSNVNLLVRTKGFSIRNVDITIICDTPHLSFYKGQMVSKISECMQLEKNSINIKGKTTEGTNITGICAYSVVLVTH